MKPYKLKRNRIDDKYVKIHILHEEEPVKNKRPEMIIVKHYQSKNDLYNWPEYWKYMRELNRAIKHKLFKKKRH